MRVNVLAQVGKFQYRQVVDAHDNVTISAGIERLGVIGFTSESGTRQDTIDDNAEIYGQTATRGKLRCDAAAVDGEPGVFRRYAGA